MLGGATSAEDKAEIDTPALTPPGVFAPFEDPSAAPTASDSLILRKSNCPLPQRAHPQSENIAIVVLLKKIE